MASLYVPSPHRFLSSNMRRAANAIVRGMRACDVTHLAQKRCITSSSIWNLAVVNDASMCVIPHLIVFSGTIDNRQPGEIVIFVPSSP